MFLCNRYRVLKQEKSFPLRLLYWETVSCTPISMHRTKIDSTAVGQEMSSAGVRASAHCQGRSLGQVKYRISFKWNNSSLSLSLSIIQQLFSNFYMNLIKAECLIAQRVLHVAIKSGGHFAEPHRSLCNVRDQHQEILVWCCVLLCTIHATCNWEEAAQKKKATKQRPCRASDLWTT